MIKLFELLFEPNELRTFYIEAYSKVRNLRARLTLYDQWAFLNNEFRYAIAFVIFFTALGIMLIYNLLLLLATKDSLYGYYLLYLISLLVFQLALFDIFKLYISSDSFHLFLTQGVLLPLMFLIFSITLFSMKFLNLVKFPKLYQVLRFYLYLAPIIALISYNNWIIDIRTALFILSPWLFIVVGSGFWAWYKGEGQAKYYVLGWSFFCLVSILTLLRIIGLFSIDNELILLYFYIAAFIIETLFFSLSITHKIEILKENEEAKLKLLVAQKTEKIENMLEQKELLYQELNHRVKNNIQMILSLLTLQIGDTKLKETKEELVTTKNRVNSLLGLYNKLYLDSNDIQVDTKTYLENIVGTIQKTFNNSIDINLEIKHKLDNSELIYCGLIVNESVTNSFKYAFVDKGCIYIRLTRNANQIELGVYDNGVGLEKSNKKSLGMEIVKALVYKQLLGRMDIDSSESGTKVLIVWEVK
jgi:two-component sensor histidine kinase